jgi:predicted unusual protein kinase regulating ubiquinone biosynthesis (AarF/ABC1/UbiB family)
MATPTTSRRRRGYRILRLFFSLVLSFLYQYGRARLQGRTYDFFEDPKNNRKRAIKLRTEALAMGGVLIKVGQFLSSRVDLLPPEYIEELALLQDEVPGVSFDEIRRVVEEELGAPIDSLFSRFDPEPLAAASLGQVHQAVLPTGEFVAVKVQRPRIDEVVRADLASLRYIVNWLDRHTPVRRRVDLRQVMREFEDTLYLELDYIREGHHAERFAISFCRMQEIVVPRIYWSHCAGRVLTMQHMWGTKVTDFAELSRQGIDRSAVAQILMRAYLHQVLEDGFFHADPHPGNIFVRPGPTVVLLDFGMVGNISSQMKANIRRAFFGVLRRDYDEIVTALDRLGFIPRDADRRALRQAVIWTVETFSEMSFGELRSVSPTYVLEQLQDIFYTESIQIPAQFAFLGRALGTLSGLCTALDPSFQFVAAAQPFAHRLVHEERGPVATLRLAASEVRSLALAAYSVPYLTRDALERVHSGELTVRREFNDITRAVDRVERSVRRVFYSVLLTGLIVAGAYVFQNHPIISLLAFLLALLILVFRLGPLRVRRY